MLSYHAWLEQNPEYQNIGSHPSAYADNMVAYLTYCVEHLEERIIELEAK